MYIGGPADEVDEKILNGALIPFDEIVHIQIPVVNIEDLHLLNLNKWKMLKHLDNKNDSEIYGRTLKVNIAKPS